MYLILLQLIISSVVSNNVDIDCGYDCKCNTDVRLDVFSSVTTSMSVYCGYSPGNQFPNGVTPSNFCGNCTADPKYHVIYINSKNLEVIPVELFSRFSHVDTLNLDYNNIDFINTTSFRYFQFFIIIIIVIIVIITAYI